MPEQSQEDSRSDVPLVVEQSTKESEQGGVASQLLSVLDIRTLVQALVSDSVVKQLVLASNVGLHLGILRWGVVFQVSLDLTRNTSVCDPEDGGSLAVGLALDGSGSVSEALNLEDIISSANYDIVGGGRSRTGSIVENAAVGKTLFSV